MKTENRRPRFQRGLAGMALAGVLLALWAVATPRTLPSGSSQPAIDSLTPASGPEGTVVTIRGANFGPAVGAVQGTSGVSFNGVGSTPASWSDGAITVSVPPGAETGEVVVTVSGQPSAGVEFSVTGEGVPGPGIGTVSPVLGVEGTVVTIRGERFGPAAEMGGVSFNGVWASASSWSEEEIRVAVPRDAGTGPVVVTATGRASNGVGFMVADSGLGEPAIHSVSSATGPEGMVVTIDGENFGPAIGALEGTSGVSFNGVWGEPTSWSETQIQVAVPAGAPSGLVTVAVGAGASNGLAFVVERPAPVIESVDSSFGPEGTRLQITGRNFGPAMEAIQGWSGVSFEGAWGEPVYWSGREIHVAVPEGVSSGVIVVSSGGQESNGIPFTVAGGKRMAPARAVAASSVAPRAGPTLKSLDPTDGPVGTAVKIKGKNFGDERGTNRVTFNGTEVTNYLSWANKRIDVEVPAGATTGEVVVRIGAQATSGIEFTVTVGTDPSITMLDPDRGPEGASVTITGVNFGATQGTSTVEFNGTAATPTSWSDTEIEVAVPMGATTGEVVVTVDGTASAGVAFTVTPGIGSLSPIAGPEGAAVEITGTNFGAVQGTSTVEFNGTEAIPTSWSDTSITVTVPAGATSGNVVVTVDGVASNGAAFAVGTDPVISSVSPSSGSSGTTVTVSGANFGATQGTSSVTFNGAAVTAYTSWSDGAITVTAPVGVGTGPVVVTVDSVASNGVTFTVKPAIGRLSPISGLEGATVEIAGTSFGASQGTSTVTFNGTAATATSWSDTSITVTVPAGATTGPVVVTVGGQASDGVTFTVGTDPVIGSVSPTSGPVGTTVAVTGANFGATQGTSSVTFGGTAAAPTSWSATSITVDVPSGAATGNVVVTVDSVASNGVSFTVTPAITGLSRIAGPEGISVTITGTSFGAVQGTGTVTFNGTAVTTYTSWSDTSITVTVPAGATSGSVVVTVGGMVSNGAAFTVGSDPIVSSLSPALGQVETSVEIGGANFGATQGTGTVTFNGTAATPSNWSDTSITVTVPSTATTGPVVVTVGTAASNQVTFTVTGPPPVIGKLKPDEGGVGDSVKVKGEHFGTAQGMSTVTFNGLKAAARKWDDDKITVNVPAGARTGPVVVTVDGQASNGVTFMVTGSSPSIISMDPHSGEVETSVTITGVNFGATQGTSTVTFNGVSATPTNWSDTSITAPVPATASTGPVVVTVNGQVSNGETFTVTVPVPSITGLNPTSGQVGASITISGEDFGDSRGASTVSFNGVAATAYASWNDSSIMATVPEGATTGEVVVTVGGQGSNGVSFTVEEVAVGVTVTPATLEVNEGSTGTYQVKLASEPSSDVTLTVASSDTDTVTVSSSSLTFTTGNWETAQTVTVTAEEDDDGGAEEETITHTAASTDSDYSGITIASVEVSVADNDPFGVTVTAETLDVDEGSTGTYEVRLATLPSADVTVTLESDNTDVTVSSRTLTFTTTGWNTAQTVTVEAAEDDDGASETAALTHRAASTDTDYDGIAIGSVEVSVTDNDPVGVTVTAETLEIIEGGDGAYQVRLSTLPSADVTVTPASSDTDKVTVLPATLTFTTSDWNTFQTVTVMAKEDDDFADETVRITHAAASTDSDYDGFTPIGSVEVSVDDNDVRPGVTVTASTLEVTEGSTGTYEVKLDTLPEATVTVTVESSDTDKVTVSSGTLTFTTGNWDIARTVTVTAEEDDDTDNETATLTHTAASTDTNYGGITIGSVAVSVTDNDTPGVTVTPASLEVGEGSTGTYEVKLDTLPEATVTVTVTEDSDNTDVTVFPSSLTFTTANWNTFQTVTVTAKEDHDDYADETATLTHTAASTDADYNGGNIAIGSVAVDVTDNDLPPITLSSDRTSVSEPSGTDTITASVPSGYAPDADLTIALTHSGTAGHGTGADYTVGTLTIPAHQTSGEATLTVQDDSIDEDEETITLTGRATGYGTSAALTIALEDDGDTAGIVVSTASLNVDEGATGQFQVKLNSEPLNNVTVGITETSDVSNAISVSGAPLTFTSSNWSAYQTVTVTGVVDAGNFADADATITVSAASSDAKYNTAGLNQTVGVDVINIHSARISLTSSEPSVSEASGSRTATITATVPATAEPANNLTINLSHLGSAEHGSNKDYTVGTLTIPANRRSGTATLTVRDDRIDEGSSETIEMTGGAVGYTTSSTLSIPLNDDDTAGVEVSSVSLDITEGNDATYQVKLNTQPTGPVTVTPSSDNTDVTASTVSFTTNNWSTYKTVTVSAAQDDDGANDSATITHSASGGGYGSVSVPSVSVTVVDDDPRRIVLNKASLTVNEGGTGTYSVKLGTKPVGGSVTVTCSESSDKISSSARLTFTTNNWNSNQSVTVTGSQDDDGADESGETITCSARGADYGSVPNRTVTVAVDDDDVRRIVLNKASLTVNEGGTGTYSVKLGAKPVGGSVIVTCSESSDKISSSARLTFTTNNWNSNQSVTVTGSQDDDGADESGETITCSARGADYGSVPNRTVTVAVDDDDVRRIVLNKASLTVNEGGTGTYSVKLGTKPVGGSVTVTCSESSDKISSSARLTFTTNNWNSNQSVTVTGSQDDDSADESGETITCSAGGADYGSVPNRTVTVAVTDDDMPDPSITSIRPPLQPPDTQVTISGSNFGSSEGSVSFGSDSVTDITSWSNTSIVCFIPAFASAGTVKVKVTTSGNQTSSGYDYTITGQSPYRRGCGQEEDCTGEEKPQKGGSGGGGSEESEDPPGGGG